MFRVIGCFLLLCVLTSAVPVLAQDDVTEEDITVVEEYMGYMSLPDTTGDVCELVPQGVGPFFYDVAYGATERELEGVDLTERPRNEDAVIAARAFGNAVQAYKDAVSICKKKPEADLQFCRCRQDKERAVVHELYKTSLERFPRWERMILKIPREGKGHMFLDFNTYADDTWAFYCGNQME